MLANAQGELPNLAKLTSLKSLDLSLTVTLTDKALESLKTLKNLENLSLRGNRSITNKGIDYITLELTNLTHLDLDGTSVTAPALKSIQRLPKLEVLRLEGTGITAEEAAAAWRDRAIRRLESIYLTGNHGGVVLRRVAPSEPSGNVPTHIPDGTDIDRAEPFSAKRLESNVEKAKMPIVADRLINEDGHLDFANSNILGDINLLSKLHADAKVAQRLKSITINNLSALPVAERASALASLAKLPNLTHLNINNCPELTDDLLKAIGEIKTLKQLNLSGNAQITDAGLTNLKRLKLDTLDLRHTAVTRKGVETAWKNHPDNYPATIYLREREKIVISGDMASPFREPLTHDELRSTLQKRGGILNFKSLNDDELKMVADIAEQEKVQITQLEIRRAQGVTEKGLAQIARFTNLETLRIRNSNITDESLIHISNLTKLKDLTLSGANITDAGFSHLKNLHNLIVLSLNRTNIGDDSLAILNNFTNLKDLHLGQTRITNEGLKQLSSLSKIQFLELAGTDISDGGLSYLAHLKSSLKSLDLNETDITGAGLTHLREFSTLEHLILGNTRLDSDALQHLSQLTKLRSLHLDGTGISTGALSHLKNLTELRDLNLSRNFISSAELEHISKLTKLRALDLGHTWIDNEGLKHLSNLTKLEDLTLDYTGVSNEGLIHFKGLEELTYLNLESTRVTGSGLSVLEDSPLTNVNLSNTATTDADLPQLAKIGSINNLDIDYTRVTEQGITSTWPDIESRPDISHRTRPVLPPPSINLGVHLDPDEGLPPLTGNSIGGAPNIFADIDDINETFGSLAIDVQQSAVHGMESKLNMMRQQVEQLNGHLDLTRGTLIEEDLFMLQMNLDLASKIKSVSLRRIDSVGPEVAGNILEYLSNLPNLTTVNLQNCEGLTNDLLKQIGRLKSLKILNLSGNKQLSRDGLVHLSQRPELKLNELDLRGTNLTRTDVDAVWSKSPQSRPAKIHYDDGTEFLGVMGPPEPPPPSGGPSTGGSGVPPEAGPNQPPGGSGTTGGGEHSRDTTDQARTAETTPKSTSGASAEAPVLKTDPKIIAGWRKQLSENKGHLTLDNPTDDEMLDLALTLNEEVRGLTIKRLPDLNNSKGDILQFVGDAEANLDQIDDIVNEGYKNALMDKQLIYLRRFKNLEYLNLYEAAVSDAGLAHLAELTNLKHLDFGINSGITDRGLAHLKGLINLRHFAVISEDITDAGLGHLEGLVNLEHLQLSGADITDDGLVHLKTLKNLVHLDLDSTLISDAGLVHLAKDKLPNLERLLVRATEVTPAGVEQTWTNVSNPPRVTTEPMQELLRQSANEGGGTETGQSPRRMDTSSTDSGGTPPGGTSGSSGGDSPTGDPRRNTPPHSDSDSPVQASGRGGGRGGGRDDGEEAPPGHPDDPADELPQEPARSPEPSPLHGRSDEEAQRLKVSELKNNFRTQLAGNHIVILQKLDDDALAALAELKDSVTAIMVTTNVRDISAKGIEHLKSLHKLKRLDVGLSNANDTFLSYISGLKNLTDVDLKQTHITDEGLEHLSRLTNLQRLGLDENIQLSNKALEHLSELTNLKRLSCKGNYLIDNAGLSYLKGLTALEEINLEGTFVGDKGLEHFNKMTRLKTVDLSRTKVTGSGLSQLSPDSLETVLLFGAPLTDEGLAGVQKLINLKHLNLIGVDNQGQLTNKGIRCLQGLKSLEILSIDGHRRVDDWAFSYLRNLTELRQLFMSGTGVNGSEFEQLAKMPKLELLHLGNCKVTDNNLAKLPALPALNTLFLNETLVTDAGLPHLNKDKLPKIANVYARCLGVTQAGADAASSHMNANVKIFTN